MRNENIIEPQNQQSCQTSVMVSADLINKIRNEDCLSTLQLLPNGSVDLLLQDTPFGCTQNDWDIKPDLSKMWTEWERVTKYNGAMIFFATQPFASELILSNIKNFRYDIIWEKSRPSGFLNANKMPLRSHEIILIFYRSLPTYNAQMRKGKPNHVKNGSMSKKTVNNNYGDFGQTIQYATYDKHPTSVIYFEQQDPNKINHPTEKPIDLIRWLVCSYSNENDLVFDGYMGSGTTAVASIIENRRFIGSELNKKYFDKATKRIDYEKSKLSLFAVSEH
ncbi:MAG: DNA-methyltransferase [bacterium]|jgi:site-specific DNA-methyltransferase (adenine-specific)